MRLTLKIYYLVLSDAGLAARKVLGWPKGCQLADAFLWGCSYKGLKLAQLGQLGVLLTLPDAGATSSVPWPT
jgi:hypothetical protein